MTSVLLYLSTVLLPLPSTTTPINFRKSRNREKPDKTSRTYKTVKPIETFHLTTQPPTSGANECFWWTTLTNLKCLNWV